MIVSFEEKDRDVIERSGISIIELKKQLYKMEKRIKDAELLLKDIREKCQRAFSVIRDIIIEAADHVKMYIEIIMDYNNQITSIRYKVVKIISKYTRIDMYRIWRATRFTWLARIRI